MHIAMSPALGNTKSGRLKQLDIANTRTPDHIIKIMQHYHRTKCMLVVEMHFTIVLDLKQNKRN